MKKIEVEVSDDDFMYFRCMAMNHHTTINRVLEQFLADYIVSDTNGGHLACELIHVWGYIVFLELLDRDKLKIELKEMED